MHIITSSPNESKVSQNLPNQFSLMNIPEKALIDQTIRLSPSTKKKLHKLNNFSAPVLNLVEVFFYM